MGAYEFIDFQLFHRALGVDRMVSVERKDVTRHTFNRPFATVEILQGQIGDLIRGGRVDLRGPTILWLDYVERLSANIVADVQDAVRKMNGPSMLIVTVSARNDDKVDGSAERLIERVGRDWVQIDEGDDESARGESLAENQRLALTAAIADSLNERLVSDSSWSQVLNVSYADGVTMQTLAGMILDTTRDVPPAEQIFRGRDYFTPDSAPLDLRVPVIHEPRASAPRSSATEARRPARRRRDRTRLRRLGLVSTRLPVDASGRPAERAGDHLDGMIASGSTRLDRRAPRLAGVRGHRRL